MEVPYVGEIRMFAGNFAPAGWAFCDGQLLSISQYGSLYSLLGTIYGGDGITEFGLPDLRGRIPLGSGALTGGQNYSLGMKGGSERVTLTINHLPNHTHTVLANATAGANTPVGNAWAVGPQSAYLSPDSGGQLVSMNSGAVSSSGASQPHDNMMPSLVVSFIIAVEGIYPSRQ